MYFLHFNFFIDPLSAGAMAYYGKSNRHACNPPSLFYPPVHPISIYLRLTHSSSFRLPLLDAVIQLEWECLSFTHLLIRSCTHPRFIRLFIISFIHSFIHLPPLVHVPVFFPSSPIFGLYIILIPFSRMSIANP